MCYKKKKKKKNGFFTRLKPMYTQNQKYHDTFTAIIFELTYM